MREKVGIFSYLRKDFVFSLSVNIRKHMEASW